MFSKVRRSGWSRRIKKLSLADLLIKVEFMLSSTISFGDPFLVLENSAFLNGHYL